jgi:hypothetical protein
MDEHGHFVDVELRFEAAPPADPAPAPKSWRDRAIEDPTFTREF